MFVSWGSKITTVNAVLGGVGEFMKEKIEFINVMQVSIFSHYTLRWYDVRAATNSFFGAKGENAIIAGK